MRNIQKEITDILKECQKELGLSDNVALAIANKFKNKVLVEAGDYKDMVHANIKLIRDKLRLETEYINVLVKEGETPEERLFNIYSQTAETTGEMIKKITNH